jgi:hypothetical protein
MPRSVFQIFIRDTQSANGTFVNGHRLSPEGQDSYPHELKTNDIIVSLALTLWSYQHHRC